MAKIFDRTSRWIYRGLWSVLVNWFRVPEEAPELPVGPGEKMDQFQPGPGYLRYLTFWFWIILFITDIALFVGWVAASIALLAGGLWWVWLLISGPWWFIIIAPDVVAFVAIHLRYDTTWYVMSERSLRIRRGVMVIHEVTITFENVQNIRIRNGPVQRYFGIADLIVETAGGGGSTTGKGGHQSGGHTGVIEGIGNAEELRDRIMQRLRHSKTAGLGDEDHFHEHAHAPGAMWSPAHIDALRTIRDELRAFSAV